MTVTMGEAQPSTTLPPPPSPAAATAAAAAAAAAPTEDEDAGFAVFVTPPTGDAPIRLDGVSAADTVLSLRQLLAEYPALACYTCYRLEARSPEDGAWQALNDFVELGEYEGVGDGAELRMVLESYDARKVRAHVRRLRDVLLNPPIPQSPPEDPTTSTPETSGPSETEIEATPEAGELDAKAQKALAEKQLARLREIHERLEGVQVPVPRDLGVFYDMPLHPTPKTASPAGRDPKQQGKKGKHGKKDKKPAEPAPTTLAEEPLSTATATLPQCLKSMVFSGYNPPPGPRKLAGDLLYLEITTEDRAKLFVTAHVTGFFVNRSTATSFDPSPAGATAHLLVDVLVAASESFRRSYASLLAKAAVLAREGPASIEWMVAAGNQVGGKLPWNTPVSRGASGRHEYDLNRAEDELCAAFGLDERGVLRDWNEEYQCCRELPAETLKEQIVRSRVLYKIVNEFVEAATQGAVAIVEGHIPPINPMDDASAHVYVFNNIFFSLSIDGKPTAKDLTGEEAAYSSANRDLQGVRAFNEADVRGLHTLATTVIDYLGVRVIAQSVIPGILQGEAASKLVYGSVDGGKTIASNPKMHALMREAAEKLHLAERRIAPQGQDAADANDATDEDAPSTSTGGEAGTAVVPLCGPVEAKGILGSDGRMYVLDLVRITPKDWTFYAPREPTPEDEADGLVFARQEGDGYVALLRPELVKLYVMWKRTQARKAQREAKAAKPEATGADDAATPEGEPTEDVAKEETETDVAKTGEEGEEQDGDNAADGAPIPEVRLNPNVFMKYPAAEDAEEAAADEAAARDAADYLQKVVIPAFVSDLRRGAISPADGHALTELMHSCGINVRYLGRIAALVKKLEAFGGISKFVLELVEVEMIARAVKHLIADELNKDPTVRAAPGAALVSLLNAILGGDWAGDAPTAAAPSTSALSDKNPNKKGKKTKASSKAPTNGHAAAAAGVAPTAADGPAVWARITAQIQQRFGYKLSLWRPYAAEDADGPNAKFQRVHKTVLLRRLCQRLGLRVASKSVDFASTAPFAVEDLTGVVPVVKHSLPAHPLPHATQLLERGRLHVSGGALATAYELLQEASTLLFQVVGGAHEDAALCSSSLATVLYHAGDVSGAIAQQQRALALYTQLEGLDYHDTAFAHANLALFLHANAQTELAVLHLRRAIYLLELCAGPHFPEVSSLYLRMGSMCQDVGQVSLALLCYRESLQRGEFDRLQAANTLHQMALACTLVGGFRDALTYEKRVYALLKETFGDQDPRVLESAKYMAKFTERAVEGAKGRREVDAAAAADAVAQELLEELAIKEDVSPKKKQPHAGKGKAKRPQH